MQYDPNLLERSGRQHFELSKFREALNIYFQMADGDPSLDAGYTAMRIGECYEKLGDLHAARYWYGRAVAENPEVADYSRARARLEHLDVAGLLLP